MDDFKVVMAISTTNGKCLGYIVDTDESRARQAIDQTLVEEPHDYYFKVMQAKTVQEANQLAQQNCK